jgi:hypothetical protein
MSKRLQVLLDDVELRDIQRIARRHKTTVAAWVRQVLRAARRGEGTGDAGRKIDAIRRAARHTFPAGAIDEMLAEIERGYGAERGS